MPDRRTPFNNLGERDLLVEFLDYLRESVVIKAGGLSDEDVRKPMVPSGTNLLGLIKHLTMADVFWFHYSFAGEDVAIPSEHLEADDTPESVIEGYRAAWAHSNELVAAVDDMDRPSVRPHRVGGHLSLRWILVHMVEETGRHAGHADILREQIDGTVGR